MRQLRLRDDQLIEFVLELLLKVLEIVDRLSHVNAEHTLQSEGVADLLLAQPSDPIGQ